MTDHVRVSGEISLGFEWSTQLDDEYSREVVEDDLVLWRPGLTIWIAVWGGGDFDSADQRLESLREDIDPAAHDFDEWDDHDGDVLYLSFRLEEPDSDESSNPGAPALYGFVVSEETHVQFAAYGDDETAVASARAVLGAIRLEG